jgi:ABC-type uncharacterized transport system permease subunit
VVLRNPQGEPMINIGFTEPELKEIVLLINEGEVDEDLLRTIKKKINNRLKRLAKKLAHAS